MPLPSAPIAKSSAAFSGESSGESSPASTSDSRSIAEADSERAQPAEAQRGKPKPDKEKKSGKVGGMFGGVRALFRRNKDKPSDKPAAASSKSKMPPAVAAAAAADADVQKDKENQVGNAKPDAIAAKADADFACAWAGVADFLKVSKACIRLLDSRIPEASKAATAYSFVDAKTRARVVNEMLSGMGDSGTVSVKEAYAAVHYAIETFPSGFFNASFYTEYLEKVPEGLWKESDTIKHQTESAEEIWRLLLSHCAKLAAAGMKPEKIAKIFGPSFKHPKAKSSKVVRYVTLVIEQRMRAGAHSESDADSSPDVAPKPKQPWSAAPPFSAAAEPKPQRKVAAASAAADGSSSDSDSVGSAQTRAPVSSSAGAWKPTPMGGLVGSGGGGGSGPTVLVGGRGKRSGLLLSRPGAARFDLKRSLVDQLEEDEEEIEDSPIAPAQTSHAQAAARPRAGSFSRNNANAGSEDEFDHFS